MTDRTIARVGQVGAPWVALLTALVLAPVSAVVRQPLAQSARTWPGRAAAIERFMRDAEVVAVEEIGVGVTNPKRVTLAPGGPVSQVAFKPIRPGHYSGHYESYLSEVAAYELDKLLDLGMVPPTVEKRIGPDVGAAIMWASPSASFRDLGGQPTAPSAEIGRWNYQLIRAKMFHNLINNRDPNLGNWLVDPAWNLILIDHSRAFTTRSGVTHELMRIDVDLWERFQALDEPTLHEVVGDWLSRVEIRAILERRDRMAEEIAALVEARGAADVFVRFTPPVH